MQRSPWKARKEAGLCARKRHLINRDPYACRHLNINYYETCSRNVIKFDRGLLNEIPLTHFIKVDIK